MGKNYKYLSTITVLFVSVLLISNIASSKITILGPFTFDGGTILFPLSYIFGDVLTEVYGYKHSRRVIWTGLCMALLMSVIFYVVGKMPADPTWGHQDAYDLILGQTPRIVLASLIAYLAGEFSNSYILAKLKIKMKGKMLWVRTIGSTIVGEGIDTVLFVLIAFWGTMPTSLLVTIILSNYVFKTGVEIFLTPATYYIVNKLKRKEQVDYYDTDTDFNPLNLKT